MSSSDEMTSSASLHTLLLLSDSALPLGSFAFSSGLESFLAHSKHLPSITKADSTRLFSDASAATQAKSPSSLAPLLAFLHDSISNQASTTLPFLLTAHAHPSRAQSLDDILDASTSCTVARRASTSQGRALLGLWTRALRHAASSPISAPSLALDELSAQQQHRQPVPQSSVAHHPGATDLSSAPAFAAHLPPLFGLVAAALALPARDAAYVFLLNHAKAVLGAAVRSGAVGPYQSQAVLSSAELRGWIEREVDAAVRQWEVEMNAGGDDDHDDVGGDDGGWDRGVRGAGVCVPAMDLWMGRHELLYSRIFNS